MFSVCAPPSNRRTFWRLVPEGPNVYREKNHRFRAPEEPNITALRRAPLERMTQMIP
jgi:hypothetical protein